MGLVYAEVELLNGEDVVLARRGLPPSDSVRRTLIRAMVDSGAYTLAINDEIQRTLDVPVLEHRTMQLAEGSTTRMPVVGPVEVRFENRRASVDAIVLPGDQEPLLGAIPMEAMDVLIDPRNGRLVVNPEHPETAGHPLK